MAGDDDRDTKTAVLEYYLTAPEKAPDGAIEELLLDPDVVFDDTLGCRIQLYHLRELDEAALEKALGEGVPSKYVRFFQDSVKFLADDKAQRPREISLELRTLTVLQHLRRPRMDWKGGKKTLEELFKRPASEAEKSAKNALLEALDHAQQANEKKVKQLLKRHTVESLNSIMGDYLKEISAHLPEPKLSSTVGSALGIAEDESVQAVASLLSIGGHVVSMDEKGKHVLKFFAHWSDGQDGYYSAEDLASCPEFKKYQNARKEKLKLDLQQAAQEKAEAEAQEEAERQAKAKAKEKALAEAKLKKEKEKAEAKLEARKEKELKAARMEELKAARMEQGEQGERQPDPLHGEQSGAKRDKASKPSDASGASPRPQKRQASASSPAASPRQARASSRVASPAAPAERRGRAAREAPVQASSSKQLDKERAEKEREEEEVARAVALAEKQKVAKKQRSEMSRAQVNKANEKRERQMSAIEKQEERLCAQLAKLQAEKAKLEKAGQHLGSCVHQLTRDEEAPHETVEEAEEEEDEVEEVTEGEDEEEESPWEGESPASNVRAAVEGVRTGIRSAVRMVTARWQSEARADEQEENVPPATLPPAAAALEKASKRLRNQTKDPLPSIVQDVSQRQRAAPSARQAGILDASSPGVQVAFNSLDDMIQDSDEDQEAAGARPTIPAKRKRASIGPLQREGGEAGTSASPPAPCRKRGKRIRWTLAEEEQLEKGVAKWGSSWKNILREFEFHACRSQVDLKDKWRNMGKART